MQINCWLWDWCHRQNSGGFDHESVYMAPGLLAAHRVSLSQKGKRFLVQELAGLTERALNWVQSVKGIKRGLLKMSWEVSCQCGVQIHRAT